MHIRRHRSLAGLDPVGVAVAKELEPGLDVRVGGIELRRSLICIEGIGDLIVA
jgi:hypothetical protein